MKKINLKKYASSAGLVFLGFHGNDVLNIVAALALIVLPFLIFFYTDRVFWKVIELKHRFHMKKVSQNPSISGILISDLNNPDNLLQSEANNFKDNPGNFLSLANGIDNQLRFVASEISGKEIPEDFDKREIFKIIKKEKFFTRCGRKKIRFIYWLRDMVHAGRVKYLSDKTTQMGICLCWEIHQEINRWLQSKS
jgi:hypothetical protein